jgi:hypothetical protein
VTSDFYFIYFYFSNFVMSNHTRVLFCQFGEVGGMAIIHKRN